MVMLAQYAAMTIANHDLQERESAVKANLLYLGYLVPVIFANHGMIDKYIGDAILAVFGSPEPIPRIMSTR